MLFSDPESGDAVKEHQKADNAEAIKNRIELMRSSKTTFDSLLDLNKKPTASERGTAIHLFLQYCDYDIVQEKGIDAEMARLLELGFISKRTAEIINKNQLKNFFESDFFEHLKKATKIHREFKFRMFHNASEFTQNPKLKELVRDRQIFIQGSVDLLIENPDGSIYICDYKTDRITSEEKQNPTLLASRMSVEHGDQLMQYKKAISKIFGKEPEKTFILSLPLGEAVEIK